jgi:hypothetical protein
MIKLDSGNVLLKPSHRKQLNAWLRRPTRLGDRLGAFDLSIQLQRSGRQVEMTAGVSTSRGVKAFRARESDWRHAAHRIIRMITVHLHDLGLSNSSANLAI